MNEALPVCVEICAGDYAQGRNAGECPGIFGNAFAEYRTRIFTELESLGYAVHVKLLDASRFGVPQKRLRVVIATIRHDQNTMFSFPEGSNDFVSVGETLRNLVASNGWEGAEKLAELANKPAPAIVGGSKKYGGADLGPVRAKKHGH